MEKRLLNIKEIREYTGWGDTKIREILHRPDSNFTIIMGNRLYADKEKFDSYLDQCAENHIPI